MNLRLLIFLFFILTENIAFSQNKERFLILEIRGLTFELLEKAHTPNFNNLMGQNNLYALPPQGKYLPILNRSKYGTSPLIRNFRAFFDCLKQNNISNSFLTVSTFQDTVERANTNNIKQYNSNELLVKDFLSNAELIKTNISYIRLKPVQSLTTSTLRSQIDYISKVDNLCGQLFKNLQERELWASTHLIILSNGFVPNEASNVFEPTPIILSNLAVQPSNADIKLIKPSIIYRDLAEFFHLDCFKLDSIITKSDSINFKSFNYDSTWHFIQRPDIMKIVPNNLYGSLIQIISDDVENEIYYTIDGKNPKQNGHLYKEPFLISDSGKKIIKAVTKKKNHFSETVIDSISLIPGVQLISVNPMPSPKYTFDGPLEFIDKDTATTNFAEQKFIGWQGQDIEVLLNFGQKRVINFIDISTLQDYNSWIFSPQKVEFYVGNDLTSFIKIGHISYDNLEKKDELAKVHFKFQVQNELLSELSRAYIIKKKKQKFLNVNYLKIVITSPKVAPAWFKIPGAQVWTFIDEININEQKTKWN